MFHLIIFIIFSKEIISNCPDFKSKIEKELFFVVPIVSNSNGAYNSKWISDFYIENHANFDQWAYVYFVESGKEILNPPCAEILMKKESSIFFENVLEDLFKIENSYGSLFIIQETTEPEVYAPFLIFSKIYNKSFYEENMPQIVPVCNSDLDRHLKDRVSPSNRHRFF